MSVEVLKKTLRLVDCEDGLSGIVKKKRKKNFEGRQRQLQQIKSLILSGDIQVDDDIDGSDNVRIVRRRKRNCSYLDTIVPETSSKSGLSLLEIYRRRKSNINLLKRNLRYMEFNNMRKLEGKKMEQLVNMLEEDKCGEERVKLRKMRAEFDGLREPRTVREKEKDQSFFSDEDFMKIGKDRIKLLGRTKPYGGKNTEGEGENIFK